MTQSGEPCLFMPTFQNPNGSRRAQRASKSHLIIGVLGLVLLCTGCRTSGLLFRSDTGFQVVDPRPSATVSLPLRVVWTAPTMVSRGSDFAVFVDHGPVQPGENVAALLPVSCTEDPSCSRRAALEDQGVYITSRSSVLLTSLTSTSLAGSSSEPEDHSVTVVLLDRSGDRVGEAFAYTEFVYNRQADE